MRKAARRLAVVLGLLVSFSVVVCAQSETVYVTKTGAKYHRAGCGSLRSSSIPMPLAQAAARYTPCKICKPPIPSSNATPSPAADTTTRTAPTAKAVESGRCQAITKKGTQCSRKAKAGSTYCWQHGG